MRIPKKYPIEKIHPRSIKYLYHKLHHLIEGKLWLRVLIGMFLGACLGALLGPDLQLVDEETATTITDWLSIPGTLFIKIIQMIVIPLIFASLIKGIAASENIMHLKKMGIAVFLFFLITTSVAIIIGIAITSVMQPGKYVSNIGMGAQMADDDPKISEFEIEEIPDYIQSIVPANIIGSVADGQMIHIVIFSLIFGIALISLKVKQSKPLLEILGSILNVCMTIVGWAMKLAPIAVFGLTAKAVSAFGLETMLGLGMYMLCVISGLAIIFAMYCGIVGYSNGMKPWTFIYNIKDVMLLTFSTSSSAAVMPLSIKTAEEKLHVRPTISQFVIPIGTTINMSGTALYQAVATIFLAQAFGIELSIPALILLIGMIVGASVGSPATPGVGIAILSIILGGIGVPASGLALILGVDRILDMSRTVLNVTGDLAACAFIDKSVGGRKTAKIMLEEEAAREKKRAITGSDVIVSGSAGSKNDNPK